MDRWADRQMDRQAHSPFFCLYPTTTHPTHHTHMSRRSHWSWSERKEVQPKLLSTVIAIELPVLGIWKDREMRTSCDRDGSPRAAVMVWIWKGQSERETSNRKKRLWELKDHGQSQINPLKTELVSALCLRLGTHCMWNWYGSFHGFRGRKQTLVPDLEAVVS